MMENILSFIAEKIKSNSRLGKGTEIVFSSSIGEGKYMGALALADGLSKELDKELDIIFSIDFYNKIVGAEQGEIIIVGSSAPLDSEPPKEIVDEIIGMIDEKELTLIIAFPSIRYLKDWLKESLDLIFLVDWSNKDKVCTTPYIPELREEPRDIMFSIMGMRRAGKTYYLERAKREVKQGKLSRFTLKWFGKFPKYNGKPIKRAFFERPSGDILDKYELKRKRILRRLDF